MDKAEKMEGYRPVEDSLERSKEAWRLKEYWEPIMRECYELALAGVNPYQSENNKRPRTGPRQYDSTAPVAVIKLANRIIDEMTPPYDSWADLVPGPILERDYSQAELEQIKEKLQEISETANMVLNQREQVSARFMGVLDMLIANMGCLLDLEDTTDFINPVNTQAISQAEVAILDDARGRLSDICRKRKIKLRHIQQIWPEAKIPPSLSSAMKQKNGKDQEIEVVEITYAVPGANKPGSNKPAWAYEVIYQKGGDGELMVQRGYNENPWTILRWMTLPGCPYGPSPVMLALPDIRVANQIIEMILQNAALAIAGMYTVRDDGVVNPDNIQITTGGMIPVSSNGGGAGPSIAPLETGRGFDIGQIVLDEYQTRIKKWLYDNGLPPASGAVRSPTEIIERVREISQDLGAGIVRVAGDIEDHVRRVINILIRNGAVKYNIQIDQFTFKVQVNAPLVRAQRLKKVQTVLEWLQMVQGTGGGQAMAIAPKLTDIHVWLADQLGVPAELINDEQERAAAEQSLATIQAAPALEQQAAGGLPLQA